MAFVNEFISEADVVKYDLEVIDKAIIFGNDARDWTIDRTRDMYLRNVKIGVGSDVDLRNQFLFSFYWRGELLTPRIDLIAARGTPGQPGWNHWKLVWIAGWARVSARSDEEKDQFISDLKEALLAFKDFGIYSKTTEFDMLMELNEGCWG